MITLLLILLSPTLSSDFPFPFANNEAKPKVAFRDRKLSKYFDLSANKWVNSDYSHQLSYATEFCKQVYPNKDIAKAEADSDLQSLSFCSAKQPEKCRTFHNIITWTCVPSSELYTSESPTATHTGSSFNNGMPFNQENENRCVNESIETVRFEECTPVETIILQDCGGPNRTFSAIKDIEPCDVTLSDHDRDGTYSGFTYAEIQCCSIYSEGSRDEMDGDYSTASQGDHFVNPFLPNYTVETATEPSLPIPLDWCALGEVEKQREIMLQRLQGDIQEMYPSNSTMGNGEDMDTLLIRIKEIQLKQNSQVADLFGEHFKCMMVDVVNLKNESMILIQKLSGEVLTEERRAEFLFNVDQQSGEMGEAKKRFSLLRDRLLKNEVNDFGFDYRAIVSHLQNVEVKLRAMVKELEDLEVEMECANGVECGTDGTIFEPPFNHHPITDAPTEEETAPTLSEETLIVIVSVISAVTIVVALVFFLIVVRRTFVKSSSGQRSLTAHTDLLTAQQYVSFLQKNGYANPTCRLPQKYLNEKD